MTLTRELAPRIAILALVLALASVVFWGNQRHVKAAAVSLPQCSDLIDNDGDGFIDFVPVVGGSGSGPDPDCTDLFDDSEAGSVTPPPPPPPPVDGMPACSDGIDNDTDGKTDWGVPTDENRDPGCTTPTDTDESDDNPPPADVCPNLDGLQESVPEGYHLEDGNCVADTNGEEEPTDQCPNLDGVQESVPEGYHTEDGACVLNESGDTTPPAKKSHRRSGGGSYLVQQGVVLGTTTEDCSKYLTAYIKTGIQNDKDQVSRLQRFLREFEKMELDETGVFDAPTLAAVMAFQAKYKNDILTPWGSTAPTGYVYYTTQRKVNELYCKGTQQFPLTEVQEEQIAQYRGKGRSAVMQTAAVVGSRVDLTQTQVVSASEESAQDTAASTTEDTSQTKRGFLGRVGDFFTRVLRFGR